MTLSVSHRTIGGQLHGEILSGREPMPWILLPVKVAVVVWDRNGRRATVFIYERVLIQGTANIHAIRPRLYDGCTVFAMGQGVPARVVANDLDWKGTLTLASVCQVDEPTRKED